MRPLTYSRPKVMLPVTNKPILEHVISELKGAGVEDIIFVVGYKDETIRDYFGNGERWDVNIKYVTQRKQQGTADALKSASHLLEDKFLMLNGDAIVRSDDIKEVLKSNNMVMGVYKVENPEDFGVVELGGGGKLKRIIEKPENPPSNLINAGLYYFFKDILKAVEETPKSVRGEYEVTDSIQLLIHRGHTFDVVVLSTWIDVGFPWDLLSANEQIMEEEIREQKIDGEVEDSAIVKGPVVLGEGSVLRSGSYIEGPVIIGKNCKIGPNCYIRPYTVIGDNCHIGNAVEIKNSIIMSNSNVPHLSYVGDSVIGEKCNLGAGTNIANLRLDKEEIKVSLKGKIINTHRRKLGAVIGDGVMTGINVSINIGTIIGNNVKIAPSSKVDGNIESNSMVF